MEGNDVEYAGLGSGMVGEGFMATSVRMELQHT